MKKLTFNSYREVIDFYKKYSKTEYIIKNNIGSPHNNLFPHQEGIVLEQIDFSDTTCKVIVDKNAVERFHPNKIDNKDFWTYAKTKFPKFSVCGAPSRSIKDCNEKTLDIPRGCNFLDYINSMSLKFQREKLNFLEIGYGHGNIFNLLKKRVNYIGIDYYKIPSLKRYKNLLTIEKSGIPDTIKDDSLHIVYSVNVLQHCSQEDRFAYLEQASKKLKRGGVFFGTCFIHTPENDKDDCWGVQDVDGRKYCHFFNQLTEVDKIDEFNDKIISLNYLPLRPHRLQGNHMSFILYKAF